MFHRSDNDTRLVIQHELRKMKKVPLALRKNKLSIFFASFSAAKQFGLFFRKTFLLDLRLGLRQKCNDTSVGLRYSCLKKCFSKMSHISEQKTEKKSQKLIRKKTEVFRLIWHKVQLSLAKENAPETHHHQRLIVSQTNPATKSRFNILSIIQTSIAPDSDTKTS